MCLTLSQCSCARSDMPKNSMPWRARSSSGSTSAQLGDQLGGMGDRLVAELDDEVALGDAAFGQIERDPVVRQARAGQHQVAGLEGPM